MILVRGPWDETSGSPELPFDVNHAMYFSGVYKYQGLPVDSYFVRLFMVKGVIIAGKDRKGKQVHWVESASFAKIRRLLEISEQKMHHEVLLTVKNLHDLSRHPFPYSVPIIPHPLP